MKLTVSANAEEIKDSGDGGAYINRSGIYDVKLNYVQVAETKNKAYQLNFNVEHKGMSQTIYGPILVNTDGNVNTITKSMFDRLSVIAGLEHGQDIETEEAEFPVGKDQVLTTMEVIPEFADLAVKMRIQMEYSVYNGDIQERKSIKAFYREDGATAAESVSGENIGKRLAIDEEKYATNVTYKDGLTEEDVKAWVQSRSNNNSATKTSTAAPAAKTGAQRPRFGK